MYVVIKKGELLCHHKAEAWDKVEVGEVAEAVEWEVDVDQEETVYVQIVEKRSPMRGVSHVLK